MRLQVDRRLSKKSLTSALAASTHDCENSRFLSAYTVTPSARIALCCSGTFIFLADRSIQPRCRSPPFLFGFRLSQI